MTYTGLLLTSLLLHVQYEIPLQSARYIHVQTRDGLGLKACLMIYMGLARQTVVTTIRERDTEIYLSPSPC